MKQSGSNLIKINQHDVKIMLQERILNPTKYADKPLLIWRANFDDGILRRVLFNFEPQVSALFKHESDKQQNGRKEAALPKWVQMKLDSLDDNNLLFSETDLNRVFCFILALPDQILNTPPTYGEFSNYINPEWLSRQQECLKAPIVVLLPFIEQPVAFEDYTQYVFTPDYDEWKETQASSHRQLIKHLVGFLDDSVSEEERNYRWYWYFLRQKENCIPSETRCNFRGTGCNFPSCWEEGIGKLTRHYNPPLAQIPKGHIPRKPTKISEIPASEFKTYFNRGISEDVIEDFRNYLMKHDACV